MGELPGKPPKHYPFFADLKIALMCIVKKKWSLNGCHARNFPNFSEHPQITTCTLDQFDELNFVEKVFHMQRWAIKCKGNYSCHMQQQSQSTNYYSYIKNLSTANLLWALLGLLFFSLSLSLYIYIYLLCINIEIYINIYYHLPLLLSFLTIHYAPVDKNGFNEYDKMHYNFQGQQHGFFLLTLNTFSIKALRLLKMIYIL